MPFLASRVAFLVPLLLLLGCPTLEECERLAIGNADGTPNACDVQACRACADACGEVCVTLEMSPHLWTCDGESFSGGDFCDADEWPYRADAEP